MSSVIEQSSETQQQLEVLQRLIGLVGKEYYHAIRKHPFFADAPFADLGLTESERRLKDKRDQIFAEKWKGAVTGKLLLQCEIEEAAVEYAKGDYEKCLTELAQCAAVVIRMMAEVEKFRAERKEQPKNQEGVEGVEL